MHAKLIGQKVGHFPKKKFQKIVKSGMLSQLHKKHNPINLVDLIEY